MPSSYSSGGRFTLQATGENNNTWGVILNSGAFQLIDTAIFGRLGFALSGTKTLTTANGAVDEARNAILDVTGGTGGTVTIPSVSKQYMARVASSGSVIITTGGITNVSLQTGDIMPVWTDGSAVYELKLSGFNLRDFISASVLGATGALPATAGNDGKSLIVSGGAWVPTQLTSANLSGFAASASDFWGGSNNTKAVTAATALAANTPVALSYAATITPDLTAGRDFILAPLTGALALANPSAGSMTAALGDFFAITITQDGSGSRLWTPGAYYKFPGGTPALSTAAGAVDVFIGYVESATIIRGQLLKAFS